MKRPHGNSITAQAGKALANHNIQPSIELTGRDLIMFDVVINSRELASWQPNDMFIATQLAQSYRRLEELGVLLDAQGFTQVNERGTQISNPIFSAMVQLTSSINTLCRTLGLTAAQKGLTSVAQKGSNLRDTHTRERNAEIDGQELLG